MQAMQVGVPALRAADVPMVTAGQMAEVDRSAVEEYGVTILQMMEQAGSHLADVVRLEVGGDLQDRRIVVAVGPGNNGGGGLAAARHLANRGATVRVVLARPALRMSEAARHQLATLIAMDIHCCVATYDLSDDDLEHELASADIVADAVLGYRIHDAPRGEAERLIGSSSAQGVPSLAWIFHLGWIPIPGRLPASRSQLPQP